MAKSFSDREKARIREALVEHGRELFAQYGLKRTSIEDLTKAAGISQGSFYAFYGSKEELYFEILEIEEEQLSHSLRKLFDSEALSKDSLKRFLDAYNEAVYGNALIKNLIRNREYELLTRKLPADRLRDHLRNESWLFGSVVAPLQDSGSFRDVRPEVLTGLFHALFLLQLHRSEIGEDVFPEVMGLMTNVIAEGLVVDR